ncbi:MAG: pyruvate ferredoxin oxidoreductase [Lachnospiraceae bacterium]|nr:pyruvate ferredoxin oxidoreductase [Lachnospiraceae bacterium]
MGKLKFISGDEAVAEGVRLARPQVVSAYPITPQTIVVERLADMVADGALDSEFVHVESEHSAMMTAMGASAMGARAFTATSSQGLLYMAECLPYVAGGRFPIVMMNANRATALPWSIYGDHRDSVSQLDSGWIQIYTENAQESLDMMLQAYALAEHEDVRVPVMVNLDGFVLTHTYEPVDIPNQEQADAFLAPRSTTDKLDIDNPVSMAYTVGPELNEEFQLLHHKAMKAAAKEITNIDNKFGKIFGRSWGGLINSYRTEDAEYVLISLGSIGGIIRDAVDELRVKGIKAGYVGLRFLRPFPADELASALKNVTAAGVLEKDISFGYEGTVYSNVNSALNRTGKYIRTANFIGGIGGRNIAGEDIFGCFDKLIHPTPSEHVYFIGLEVEEDV